MGGHVIASFGVVTVDSFACLKWEFEKDKRLEISFFSLPAPFFFSLLSLSLSLVRCWPFCPVITIFLDKKFFFFAGGRRNFVR